MATVTFNDAIPASLPVSFSGRDVDDFTAELRGICGGFIVEPVSGSKGRVEGGLARLNLGRYDTALVALETDCVSRSPREIRRDPGEHLFLLVQQQGRSAIEQGENVALLQPGDMYLVDSACPSRFRYNSGRSVQISMHIPRQEALSRFGRHCLGGVGIAPHDPLAFAMKACIGKLLTADSASASLLGEALMNLLGAYLRCAAAHMPGEDRGHDRLLEEAFRLIERHASDPAFDAGVLTRLLGVSPRTLQRRFEAVGETVSGRILDTRLALARAILTSREAASQPGKIAAIAFECGFNDLSSFYRAFRNRFGAPPGSFSRLPFDPRDAGNETG